MDEPKREIDLNALRGTGLLASVRGRLRARPAAAMAAGIVCGMLAFALLFAPIFPAPQRSGYDEPLELGMPERPPAEASAGPAAPPRVSLIGAILPQAVPSWLGGAPKGSDGGPGERRSVAAVLVEKARTAVGLPARPEKGAPGRPEPLKAAGDAAFRQAGQLRPTGGPHAGGGSTSASLSLGSLAARLPSQVAPAPPVQASGQPGPGGTGSKPRVAQAARTAGRDTTQMVTMGERTPSSASLAASASPDGSARLPAAQAPHSATSLPSVPEAVTGAGRATYRGPATQKPEEKGEPNAHDVDRKLPGAGTAGPDLALGYLASLFEKLPLETRRKLTATCTNRIARGLDCDPVAVCLEAQEYAACEAACQQKAECSSLDLFPPTPVMTVTPSRVRVGGTRTVSVSNAAAGATIQILCWNDGKQKCGGSSTTSAAGAYRDTANATEEHLAGGGRWCASAVVGSGPKARTSNEACIEVLAE